MRRASGSSPNPPLGYGVTIRGIGTMEGGGLPEVEGGFSTTPRKVNGRAAVEGWSICRTRTMVRAESS